MRLKVLENALDRISLSTGDAKLVAYREVKAIAIANALLTRGMEEGRAIRIAIAQAKKWAHLVR